MENKNLLENYDELPKEIQDLFKIEYNSYSELERLKQILKEKGYYMDFGLDCEVTELYKINE